jgi:hypothetical protein
MQAERDYLVKFIFPQLRKLCESRGVTWGEVDLRWGVPAKNANGETANSWEYCGQWIDRVEPCFVCIHGHFRSVEEIATLPALYRNGVRKDEVQFSCAAAKSFLNRL